MSRNTPIHRKLLLVVGLDWAILWETLDNFDGAVELGIDKLVRVHGSDKGQYGVWEVGRGIEGDRESTLPLDRVLTSGWVFGKMGESDSCATMIG